jgi:predicted methyltransferase
MIVLSRFQTRPVFAARRDGKSRIKLSLDLGRSQIEVLLAGAGVVLPDLRIIDWSVLEIVDASENNCFAIGHSSIDKILTFSKETRLVYTLMPTASAPTMLASGIPMHRIKDSDPMRDTLEKIRTVKPLIGQVLDTATGLGYTAIEAAKTAEHVVTVEVEPAVLDLAGQNPWSEELFDNPKIEQRVGDSYDVIQEFPNGTFDRIVHDPPAFSLAGHLYSQDFYLEMARVLRPKGRVFHYVGNPDSRSGRNITRGVKRRLEAAGFSTVRPQPRAFGVVAWRA